MSDHWQCDIAAALERLLYVFQHSLCDSEYVCVFCLCGWGRAIINKCHNAIKEKSDTLNDMDMDTRPKAKCTHIYTYLYSHPHMAIQTYIHTMSKGNPVSF